MKIIRYLLILLIPLLILLISFRFVVFDTNFYDQEFSKYGVYDKLGNSSVNKNAASIISYLKNEGELVVGFLNEKEILHMGDVKGLMRKTFIALYFVGVTVLLLTIYMFMKKDYGLFARIIMYSGILSLLVIFTFLLAVSLDFEGIFNAFHVFGFDNDLWLLNPENDNLIVMFPEGFFYDATLRIIYIAGAISLASIIFGLILLKISRKSYISHMESYAYGKKEKNSREDSIKGKEKERRP